MTLLERFSDKILVGDDCWEWTAGLAGGRYGSLWVDGAYAAAHRVSYALFVGDTSGMCVLHRCDNPTCVKPSHLFLGTQADNVRDREEKGRGGTARLSIENVRAIRELVASGLLQRVVGARFGISQGHVSEIVHRKYWVSA